MKLITRSVGGITPRLLAIDIKFFPIYVVSAEQSAGWELPT